MTDREFTGKMTLAASQYGKERDYWLNQLAGQPVKTRFPYDTANTGYQLETFHINLKGELFEKLMKVSKNSDYTLHMVLTAGLTALLGKYTTSRDILMGMPIYNQEKEGEFLNTALALRNQLEDTMSFKELLIRVRQTIIEANRHQNYPLETLLYQLKMTGTGKDFPLFDIVILLENIHQEKYIRHTHPNVIFSFLKKQDSIEGKIEYNALLYHRDTIERMTRHYTRLLEQAVINLEKPVLEIHLLSEKEKSRLLEEFNRTSTPYPAEKTIDELFSRQAGKTPGKTALIDEQESLTYKTLDESSHNLAVYLQSQGLRHEEAVGIMAENNVKMIIGILGILKAGAAYLPLNSEYPEERRTYLQRDGNVQKLLITAANHQQAGSCRQIHGTGLINLENPDVYPQQGSLEKNHTAHSLAYIIYTSGSTGKPKGAMVPHRGVVRLVKNTNYVEFRESDRLLQTGALDFDASTFEIWGALLNGLQLYLAGKEAILTPGTLKEILEKNRVTTTWMTASLFNQLLDEDFTIFKGLRNLLVGGEALSPTHINRVRNAYPGLKVINGYGPTENTTFSLTHLIEREYRQSIPIGKPIANSTAYIVDKQNHPVPIGVPGELCVGGDGLARGYLNNPESTNEKFCLRRPGGSFRENRPLDPRKSFLLNYSDHAIMQSCNHAAMPLATHRSHHSTTHHSPLTIYRTGDLARWQPDGNVEFLGRIDQQIKIRGYRIEPGEIETQLVKQETIQEAVVVVRGSGLEKYLCAYIVTGGTQKPDITELKQALLENLPDYMIPSFFVQIKKIPLTANGKVDQEALPAPEIQAGANYTAPRHNLEKKLLETWSQVLGVEKDIIGIDTDFFDLGGHSLKATLLIARIHKELQVKIPLVELFRAPTIREMAAYLKTLKKDKFLAITCAEKKEYYELSSPQKRLYVLQQMKIDGIGYNVPLAVVLEGELNRRKPGQIFMELLERHESFRTSFEMVNEEPVQKIHEKVTCEIEYYDLTRARYHDPGNREPGTKSYIYSFIRPFDLSRAPLMRIGLVKTAETNHILIVDIHHIITDGTSTAILVKEFMKLYGGEELPPARIQYKDFSQWWNKPVETRKRNKLEEYWQKQFAGEIPVIAVPTDYPRPMQQVFAGGSLDFEIDVEETRALKSLVLSEGGTLFIVLSALYNILLSKICTQEDIVIGTPVAGRRHDDLQQIVGMFVNTLAIRNNPVGEKTIIEFLKEVKENTLGAFENQEYPFEVLVNRLAVTRDPGRNPLVNVMFSLHNERDPEEIREIMMPGLKLKPYHYEENISLFDMEFIAIELDKRISCTLSYCSKLFKKETVERFVNYFKRIIGIAVENPGTKIAEIDIIPEEEKQKILYRFNDTAVEYPRGKTIHELFAGQVQQTPDHMALVGKEDGWKNTRVEGEREANLGPKSQELRAVTYKELNEKARQLARLLQEKGVRPDTIAAIQAKRSIEMIIGILGILKAGGAYLPIAPGYPPDRIDFMLKDSSTGILLTDDSSCLKNSFLPVLSVSSVAKPAPQAHLNLSEGRSFTNDQCPMTNDQLAYIIYTSGSTGRPKGVPVTHQNVAHLAKNPNFIHLVPNQRLLLTGSLSFDITTFEIWGSLLNGLTLFLIDQETLLNGHKLEKFLIKNSIAILHLIPQLFNQLADSNPGIFKTLDYFLVGGDIVQPRYINKIRKLYNNLKILHMYGPTENTTFSTYYAVDRDFSGTIPIGKPLGNCTIYIINKYHRVQPLGTPGELLVGGAGVAPGYLNNPELTAEKFDRDFWDIQDYHDKRKKERKKERKKVPGKNDNDGKNDPIPHSPHSPSYRTGDLARWQPDGNIEFLGRIDQQVKIRGMRVEPGEIENRLRSHDRVKEAVVLAEKDKYLCAYLVMRQLDTTAPGKNVFKAVDLKEYLVHMLPDYMIPTHFIEIDQIPLTPNGKIDTKALPAPKPGTPAPGETKEAPRDEIEKKLADLWSQLLEIDIKNLEIHADFFAHGGHSLKAVGLVSKIRKEFNLDIPLEEVFKTPTIKSLAGYIRAATHDGSLPPGGDKIRQRTAAGTKEGLFLLKPGSPNAKHLFLVHDGTGEVEGYLELCRHINNDMHYWGLRANPPENPAPGNLTIKDMARTYIEKMKGPQPHGPYYIAGWSLGGLIAFEIARQLEQQQEKSAFLGIIDTPPPTHHPKKETREKAGEFNLETEMKFIGKYAIASQANQIKAALKDVNEPGQLWLSVIEYLEKNHTHAEDIRQAIGEYGMQDLPNFQRLNLRESVYYLNVVRTFHRTRLNYRPTGKIHTPVYYFAAAQSREITIKKWNDYCRTPVRFYEIPGDHFSILKNPGVKMLANLFDKIMSKTT